MKNLLIDVLGTGLYLQKSGWGFPEGGMIFAGLFRNTLPDANHTAWESMRLEAGQQYALIAAGDERVTDLDIFVFDEGIEVGAADADTSNHCRLGFTVPKTGVYRVGLRIHDSTSGGGFASMLLLQKKGNKIPPEAVVQSLGALVNLWDGMVESYPDVLFEDSAKENTWAFYGVVVKKQDPILFSPQKWSGNRVILAAGDKTVVKPLLSLRQGETQTMSIPQGDAVAVFARVSDTPYRIALGKLNGDKPSLIFATVLVAPDKLINERAPRP